MSIPLPFWKAVASVAPTTLRIDLLASTLTIVTQTGSETWVDQNLTDSQANNGIVNWDFTPAGGYVKPTFNGTSLNGEAGDFVNMPAVLPTITPIPEDDFDSELTAKITAVSATGEYFSLFSIFTDLVGIQVQILTGAGPSVSLRARVYEQAAPFVQTTVGPIAITSGVVAKYGIVVLPGMGGFSVELTINGVVGATQFLAYPLGSIQTAQLIASGGETGSFDTLVEYHRFELNCPP